VLLVVGATILGATVFREPIASAAQLVNANITGPLDAQGDVKVHEQGTANVAVTNGPATQPVQVADRFQLAGSDGTKISYTVPAGRRLVLEYAAAEARGPSGDRLFVDVNDGCPCDPSNPPIAFLPLEFQGDFFGEDRYTASAAIRAYVEGGHKVFVEVGQAASDVTATFRWTLSGYLVDG
jgi:hypothetical protein